MAASSGETYPRPDFERPNLNWKSLNGTWDFIFDDSDVGLSERWQHTGIPTHTLVKTTDATDGLASEAESITQKIAANAENLIKNNAFTKSGSSTNEKRHITVPFVFQSPASGINERGVHEVLWYERTVEDLRSPDEKHKGDRVLVRFGAVDYDATIWLDGQYVGGHRGGHVPFDVDITDALETPSTSASLSGNRRLTIRVYDSAYDLTQPRGKQYWAAKPESIFYTPSSGIWQNMWIETLPATRIASSSDGTIIRSNEIDSGDLHCKIAVAGRRAGHKYSVQVEASLGGVSVSTSEKKELPKEADFARLSLNLRLSDQQRFNLPDTVKQGATPESDVAWRNGVALWSPEHPYLYDLTLRLFDTSGNVIDQVNTQTGMRSLNWMKGDGTFRLNDRPIFQSLVLDQGYWPETFMTPPTAQSLKDDIVLSQNMGFNGCRKHQKVEDPIFLYWADKLGYLIWGEMGNGYQFNEDYVERFDQEWMESVRRDINHPSIVTWTPVNESWGYTDLKNNIEQRNHIRSLYYMTKCVVPILNSTKMALTLCRTLDPTRGINDNCGWEHVCNDLTTFHDYADGPELTETCKTMEGILKPKADREVFTNPISNALVSDPGIKPRDGAPVMCTEFGGVNIAPQKGDEAGERDWGYTTASGPEDLVARVQRLMMGVVEGGHICGFVYTQL